MAAQNPRCFTVHVRYYFASAVRAMHWIRALLLVFLPASGFYLAAPFISDSKKLDTSHEFLQAYIRGAHVIAGWLLAAMFFWRFYLFVFFTADGRSRFPGEMAEFRVLFSLRNWIDNLLLYGMPWQERPEPGYAREYDYGPLQMLSYFFLYLALGGIVVTGVLLAAPFQSGGLAGNLAGLLEPVLVALGGLAGVRAVHHWLTWVFIIFTVVHIYMAVWNGITHRNMRIEAIVSGYAAEDGVDLGDGEAK